MTSWKLSPIPKVKIMIEIRPADLTKKTLFYMDRMPLIICTDSPRIYRKLQDADYTKVSINAELSKALLSYKPEYRPSVIETELKKLLPYHVPILIKDFEMLFDPRYEIDVLKFFCEKARIINVAVKWPGKFVEGKLTYSEPKFPDYHEYNCNSYQIRVVQ